MNQNEIREKKNINKKENKKFLIINESQNYSLKLYPLIEKIKNSINDISQMKDNEYILNILLMSSKLGEVNKLNCLLLLYYLYQKKGKKQNYVLHYLYHKICKLCLKLCNFNNEIVQKYLYPEENPNFLQSMKHIYLIKKIFSSEKKLDFSYKSYINNLEKTTDEKTNLYLEENSTKFSTFDLLTEYDLIKILDIASQLLEDYYFIDNEETPLYLIDKMWIIKLKTFMQPYIESRKEKLIDLFCENAFNKEKVFEFIQAQKNNLFEMSLGLYFPGPISNLNLYSIKDFWYDPLNIEENDIMKDDLKYKENYYLVKKDDYFFLRSIFKESMELKRKNINAEIYKFKVIIIEPRLAHENNKHLLKKRYLQIDVNGKVNELKNKIIRCLDYELNDKKDICKDLNYYDNLYENNDVDFFVVDKKNKEILIELFISFVNKNKIYESLYIQKIQMENNEECIKDLFNYFDKKTQILIAEIIPKNSFNFIKPITNENKNKNIYNCSLCGEQFNIREKYICQLCNLSLFCSYNCAKISGEHINLHQALNKFYIRNFEVEKLLSEKMSLFKDDIKSIIPFAKDKNNNYSAINSIIHCLSNSTDLTKYILSKKYFNDINMADFLLNKTIMVNYYYQLLNKIWKNEGEKDLNNYHNNFLDFLLKKLDYSPNDKNSLNDVGEIITFILNNFHKEINRANNLNLSKTKESSIITDLFQGTYQTTFSCSKCGNVSIKNDFSKYLLLPVPKKNSNLIIKYFSEYECRYINYTIDDNSDIKELKDKACNFLSDKINKIIQMMGITDLIDITAFDTDDEKILTEVAMYNSLEIVQLDKNKIVNKVFLTDKKEVKEIKEKEGDNEENDDECCENESDLELNINKIYKDNNDIELVFYEKSVFDEPCVNIYIYPFIFDEKEKARTTKDKLYHVYPIAIPAKLSLILENFEYYVNVKLRCLLTEYHRNQSEKEEINYIELVYPHYFCNNSILSLTTCSLCKEKTRTNLFCPLFSSIDRDLTIKDLIERLDYPIQPIILLAKSSYFDKNKNYYRGVNCFYTKKENIKKQENKLDLYNCFQLYTKKETLRDTDWFCNICNSKQICEKQLVIYSLPLYLIIQIDRFALKKINNKNNVDNTLISIPINNLDLTEYVEGNKKNKIKYKYNLYAIIYKDISSKTDFTYYACKTGSIWVLFKDNKIQKPNDLINKNIHFLFYKREDTQQ